MEDIMKIVKSLEDSGLLLKGVSETIQNEAKEQKGGFLSTLLGTLCASLLGNMLAGKEINRAAERRTKACYRSWFKKIIILPHPLTNFEIQNYYHNEPRFNEVYSRYNLHKIIKGGAYVTYFDSFGVEHIPKEI